MKKRVIAAMLSLSMAATMFPSNAFASEIAGDTVAAVESSTETTEGETEQSTEPAESEEEIADAKKAAKAELTLYWGESETKADYDAEGVSAIKAARTEGETAIENADSSAAVDDALAAAKAKIDGVPTIAEKCDEAKTAAKAKIGIYYGTNGEEVAVKTDYDNESYQLIHNTQYTCSVAINKAQTAAEVNELFEQAKADIDAVDTIAEHKVSVKGDIDAYFPEERATGLGDYSEANQTAITEAKETAKKNVDAAETNSAMDGVLNDLMTEVDAIDTIAETDLATAKAEAKETIRTYYPDGLSEKSYTETQYNTIEEIRSEYTSDEGSIAQAESSEAVAELVTAAKEAIDAVETKEQLSSHVASVAEEITAIGSVTISNYNDKYEAIKKAEDDYATLEDGENGKDSVDNYSDLETARTNYDTYKCQEVVEKINALPEINDSNYVENADAITELEGELKTIKNFSSDAEAANTTLETARENYEAAVAGVTDFEEEVSTVLGEMESVNYSDKETVDGVTSSYENLTETQKSQVSAETMDIYNAKVGAIQAFEEAIANAKDMIDALPEDIIGTDEDKAALEAAREAYSAITDDNAKEAVENLDVLQAKEAAYVDALIGQIGDVSTVNNDVISNTEAAKKAYDALAAIDETAVGNVTKKDDLDNAISTVQAFNGALTQNAANTAETAFAKVQDVTEVTDDNKADVEAAIAAYNDYAEYDAETAQDTYAETVETLSAALQTYEDALKAAADQELADKIKEAEEKAAEAAKAEAEAAAAKEKAESEAAAAKEKAAAVEAAKKEAEAKAAAEKAAEAKAAAEKAVKSNLANGSVSTADQVYTGKAAVPAVSVKDKDGNTVSSDNYIVVYENNVNVGTSKVTVIAKTDNAAGYTGYISTSFSIKPAKASFGVKAGKKKAVVTVKAQAGAKYQIAYKVKGAKSYKKVNTSSAKKTIKKLKKGKKYTLKVRAYAKINGKTVYGAYSKAKTVKVK